jgi:hypothetical protein
MLRLLRRHLVAGEVPLVTQEDQNYQRGGKYCVSLHAHSERCRGLWDGVEPAWMVWVTAQQAVQGQPRAARKAMAFYRLVGIGGAGWRESTCVWKGRRHPALVAPEEANDHALETKHAIQVWPLDAPTRPEHVP